MNRLKEIYEQHIGFFMSNLLSTICWIIFLIILFPYNNKLTASIEGVNGWLAKAFKLVFSSENQTMMWFLLIAFGLILWLVINTGWFIKLAQVNVLSDDAIKLFGLFSLFNIGAIIAILFSIIAPILLSFFIVAVVLVVILYALNN